MANYYKQLSAALQPLTLEAESDAVTVKNTALADLLQISALASQRLFVEVQVAANALAGFTVLMQSTPNAPWVTMFSLSTDYLSPRGLLVGASGDLTAQAASGTGWLILDTAGIYGVRMQAQSSSAAGSLVTVFAGGA